MLDSPIFISRILENVPAWFMEDEHPGDLEELVFSAARHSFLYKRYLALLEEEGRYWGEEALGLLRRNEVPRWVDQRRHIAQYRGFGKKSWTDLYGLLFHRQLGRLLACCCGRPGPILDLGCGCGWLSLELARLGKDVVGLDISETSIRLARFFFERRNLDTGGFPRAFCGQAEAAVEKQGSVRYEVRDLNNLKLPEASFSAVVSWESLHHVHDIEGVAEQTARCLKPGGVFLVHETIHESINGNRLHHVMTSPRMLEFVAKRHQRWSAFEPQDSQAAFFEEFQRSFPSLKEGEKALWSPFEGVGGDRVLSVLTKYFAPMHVSRHHHILTEDGAFRIIRDWTEHLGHAPDPKFSKRIFSLLSCIDTLAIRFAGLRPRHVFLVLKPRHSPARPPHSLRDLANRLAAGSPPSDESWEELLRLISERIQAAEGLRRFEGDPLDDFSVTESFRGRIGPAEERCRLMLIDGWHLKEDGYRWTNGRGRAFFSFPEGSRELELELMGDPQASPSLPQDVRIAAESETLGRISIVSPGWRTYRIPLDRVPRCVFELAIVSGSFIPRERGMSDDSRRLGVAVRSIRAV